MKLLLVNQPIYNPHDIRNAEPLGLAYIAAVLEKHGYGKDVEIFDPNPLEKRSSEKVIIDEIISRTPQIVGFSTFSRGFQYTLKISLHIKKLSPQTSIIFGGHLATALRDIILERFPQVDIVVRGEGEYTMLDLVRAYHKNEGLDGILGISYRENKRIKTNDPRPLIANLDELPFPARHKCAQRNESTASILSSRGCPFSCYFCDISSFYRGSPGLVWRARSAKNVVDEIEHLLGKGVKLVNFVDDCFLVDPYRVEEICREIKRRNLRFSFTLPTRADQIIRNSSLLPLLRQSGCVCIEMGVENGCQNVLDRYGKQLKVSDSVKALDLVRKNKIGYEVDFILFDMYTTMEELSDNMRFIDENNLSLQSKVFFGYMKPYPGTRIYEQYLSETGLSGDFFAPSYRIKDERASMVFKAILKFERSFEAKRIRKIDEIENSLEIIDDFVRMLQHSNSSANNRITRRLNDLSRAYRFYRTVILRFPFLFFKLVMQEAKRKGSDDIKLRFAHWFSVFHENLSKQYQKVDELKAELEEVTCKTRDS